MVMTKDNTTASHRTAFSFVLGESKLKEQRFNRKQVRQINRLPVEAEKKQSGDGLPRPVFGAGGPSSAAQGWGLRKLKARGVPTTAHLAATTMPWLAGPSLGSDGVMVGDDLNGGGAFCIDPWELYRRGIISGMSAMVFGQVGSGKSTMVKIWSIRLVLSGRKLSVISDIKGEWTVIVEALGGQVIKLGPGLETRVNPLDEGRRPSLDVNGRPMSDAAWADMVRKRRLGALKRIVQILEGERPLLAQERNVLTYALDTAVERATAESRTPILPDVVAALWEIKREDQEENPLRSDGANVMAMALEELTTGDMAGMFDAESTVQYDPFAPAVSLDTSALGEADQRLRNIVSSCSSTWTEAMVAFAEAGQRVVVNEEGWSDMASKAALQSKVRFWKLARAYGIFNILILHKLVDLDTAGDAGSQEATMARGLLAESEIKVIHRQDASALAITSSELEISERERALLKDLDKGVGLWRVGPKMSFEVYARRSEAEKPLVDTDDRMDGSTDDVTTATATGESGEGEGHGLEAGVGVREEQMA
ncbi:conjugal transfer protein TraC [Nesterenkonia sp. K-15-9-6]|uniref:conjugal transfer protein TraC n=1 Tax=Nesterenkonia sp. K-15-9-6 TaxID=3093918 RepID=UPI004044D5EC